MSKDFAMFSDRGNALVAKVVDEARVQGWDWPKVQRHLLLLSKAHPKSAIEAYDTAVREVVYTSLNFNTPFYGRGMDDD